MDWCDISAIRGKTYDEVTAMLRDSSGSTVNLKVMPGNIDLNLLGNEIPDDDIEINKGNKTTAVAYVNIYRDIEDIDLRSGQFLAQILESQLRSEDSPVRWAKATCNISKIKIGPPHANRVPRNAHLISQVALHDQSPGTNLSRATAMIRASPVSSSGQITSRSTNQWVNPNSDDEKSAPGIDQRIFQTLVEGQRRANQTEYCNIPAQLNLCMYESGEYETMEQGCNEISAEVATVLYLDSGAFRVESTSPGTFCITIYPGQSSEQSKGRQHLLASQLVAWILNRKSNLNHNSGSQFKAGKSTPGDVDPVQHLLRTTSVSLGTLDGIAALTGEGFDINSSAVKSTHWVPDSSLGVAWEQMDKTHPPYRYWVNHRDKLISFSHPSELVPIPGYYEQVVDDQRRIIYRNCFSNTASFIHPATPCVRCGIFVEGKSMACMMLRDWVEVNGWKDLDVRLLEKQKWANKAFIYSSSDPHYKQLFEKSESGRNLLVAEWCFDVKYDAMDSHFSDQRHRNIPTMNSPTADEFFPYMALCCVETLLVFYPPNHYMIFRAIQDDDEEDEVHVPCFHPVLATADKIHCKTRTYFDTSLLTLSPDGYEPAIIAISGDFSSIKFQVVYLAQQANQHMKFGRVFVLQMDSSFNTKDELMMCLEAGAFHTYESLAAYLVANPQHQIRIDPTAEHPTSRRNVDVKTGMAQANSENQQRTSSLKFPPNYLNDDSRLSGQGQSIFDKYVVSITRTVPLRSAGSSASGKELFGIGIDIEEFRPGMFQISSVHDDCSEAAISLAIGDEIVSIDGHEINLHSLTILALQGAGKVSSEAITAGAVVRDLLLGPRGSVITLILKHKSHTTRLLEAQNALSETKSPVLIQTLLPTQSAELTPLAAKPTKKHTSGRTKNSRCCWR